MAGAIDQVVSLVVLHRIGLERYATGVVKRILGVLRRSQSDIEAQIKEQYPSGENRRDATSMRLAALLDQNRQTQAEANAIIRTEIEGGVLALAEAEAVFVEKVARVQVGTSANLASVSAAQLRAAAVSQPFQGRNLREYSDLHGANWTRRTKEAIQTGYVQGEAVGDIVKRVRKATEISEKGADLIVRTAVNHINSRAVAEQAKANPFVFDRWQFIAMLDSRTTPVCRSHSGKIYKTGTGPIPPLHPRCRSTTVNLVVGIDPAEDISFATWLRDQSATEQRDILGSSRYDLWKKGGIEIDRFTDRTGKTLTLEDLRKRDGEAFRKAGLS